MGASGMNFVSAGTVVVYLFISGPAVKFTRLFEKYLSVQIFSQSHQRGQQNLRNSGEMKNRPETRHFSLIPPLFLSKEALNCWAVDNLLESLGAEDTRLTDAGLKELI